MLCWRYIKHLELGAAWRRCVVLIGVAIVLVFYAVTVINSTMHPMTLTSPTTHPMTFPTLMEKRPIKSNQIVIDRFLDRRAEVQQVCLKTKMTALRTDSIIGYIPANLSVCIVHKAASTVWVRLLTLLAHEEMNATQLQSQKKWLFHHKYGLEFKSYNVHGGKNTSIMRTVKIMTARDPYTRLWSAYIDKFLLPMFYQKGRAIIKRYRASAATQARPCGHDVTFEEFIRFVIDEGHHKGRYATHWLPASDICDPCEYKPDFIVKYETLKSDLEGIIQTLGLSDTVGDMFSGDPTESIMKDELDVHFKGFEGVKRCMTETDYLHRIWTGLAVNGYIPPNEDLRERFESTPFESSAVLELAISVRHQYGVDKHMSSDLRHQALVAAYKQIPEQYIRSLQKLYNIDFKMFSYDSTPPSYSENNDSLSR